MTELRVDLDALADSIAERVAERLERPGEGWLDVDQAAAHIAAPKSRVYDLIAQDRLEVRRDGRRILTRAEWLDAAMNGSSK